MEDEFQKLEEAWVYWNGPEKIPDAAVLTNCPDCVISFVCADQSFHVRRDCDWRVVDSVDDRGNRYNDIARFSSPDLLVKYLIWLWGSSARSALVLPSLGAELFRGGRNEAVSVIPSASEWKFEIVGTAGRAILSEPDLTIFTNLIERSLEDVDKLLRQGLQCS